MIALIASILLKQIRIGEIIIYYHTNIAFVIHIIILTIILLTFILIKTAIYDNINLLSLDPSPLSQN